MKNCFARFPRLTLALCVFDSTFRAESRRNAPPQDQRVAHRCKPLEDRSQHRQLYHQPAAPDFEQADHRCCTCRPTVQNRRSAVALLRIAGRGPGDASINSSAPLGTGTFRTTTSRWACTADRAIHRDIPARGNCWENTAKHLVQSGDYLALSGGLHRTSTLSRPLLDRGQLNVVSRNLAESGHWSADHLLQLRRLYREHD